MAKPKSSGTFRLDPVLGASQGGETDRTRATPSEVRPRPDDDELWSLRTVAQKTGLSRASIYRYAARGLFPARRRIGPGRVAWLGSEVRAWMEGRPLLGRQCGRPSTSSDRRTDQGR
jgi:prophage regulatory protein